MNYEQAIRKVKRFGFGIVVREAGLEELYYVIRCKCDDDIESLTSETQLRGQIVAVKSGPEIYMCGGVDDSVESNIKKEEVVEDKKPEWGV